MNDGARPVLLALGLLLACGPGPSSDCGEIDPPSAGEPCGKEGDVCQLADPCLDGSRPLVCKDKTWQEDTPNCNDYNTSPSSSGDATTDPTSGPTSEPTTAATTEPTTDVTPTTGGDDPVPCGEQLPPEGSPCAPEGAQCSPNEHPCDPFIAATCDDGEWRYVEVGPGDPVECGEVVPCDPEDLPPEGSKCSLEGESCSNGCFDPCEFCDLTLCMNGTWKDFDVLPAPCLDCESVCELVVPAGCAGGPPDARTCVTGCHADQDGECHIPFNQALACIGDTPTFTCDAEARPVVDDCESQFEILYMCTGN